MFREINLHWGILGVESAAWDAKPVSDEIPTSFIHRQGIECEYFGKEIFTKIVRHSPIATICSVCLTGSGTLTFHAERLQISNAPQTEQNRSIWNHC